MFENEFLNRLYLWLTGFRSVDQITATLEKQRQRLARTADFMERQAAAKQAAADRMIAKGQADKAEAERATRIAKRFSDLVD